MYVCMYVCVCVYLCIFILSSTIIMWRILTKYEFSAKLYLIDVTTVARMTVC